MFIADSTGDFQSVIGIPWPTLSKDRQAFLGHTFRTVATLFAYAAKKRSKEELKALMQQTLVAFLDSEESIGW